MTHEPITCLNGVFMAASAATVPLADRGFRFGDGVFETILLHCGVPYQWTLHMKRLEAGLLALQIASPCEEEALQHAAREVIHKNAATSGFLRISISRGVGSHGYMPTKDCAAAWAIEYVAAQPLPEQPIILWLSPIAKIPSECLPSSYKLAQAVNNTLAALDAREHGCDDALQLDIRGCVSETSAANIFWIKDNRLFTPAFEANCLAGTTRDAVIRLSPCDVTPIAAPLMTLQQADAVFITNARLGVHAVARIEPQGRAFATNHPLLLQLQKKLRDDRDQEPHAHTAFWSAQ